LNSIVATNVEINKKTEEKRIQTIPLNLSLYSYNKEIKSENIESMKSIDEVVSVI
jgi:hypothetical protein